MPNALQTAVEVWRRMGLIQRLLMLSILAGCGVAAALLVGWARTPQMAMLYTGLESPEAAAVVEKIREQGIPYELRDGGTAVYVPAEKVYALRLELAGDGLPAGGQQGYRILDEEKIGASPFSQRINYARALEGELAKTIMLIEGVADARIHIVRPDTKLFRERSKGASATVALRLASGRRLSEENVAAIIHMVAGSVDNLKPEDVVVVDSRGSLLSRPASEGFAGGAGTLLDYKSKVEQYLAKKAEDMLTLVLGPGKATVRVDATIQDTSRNETVEKYDPAAKVPTKEETTSKSQSGGTPGAAETSTSASGNTKEETITTEYLVGRTVEQTINMPGKIISLSVAAFVDLTPPTADKAAEGATPAGTPTPPAPALTVADVELVIRNVMGLKEADALKVVSAPFHRPEAPAEEPPPSLFASAPFYLDVARHGSLGVLVIGALIVLKVLGGAKHKLAPAAGGLEAGRTAGGYPLLAEGGQAVGDPDQLSRRITAALQENPDEVRRLFRTWVETEEGRG